MQLTVPTILTLLRIALIPFLVLFFYLPFHWNGLACVVVFVTASITDLLDGYLARRTGQSTSFGAFLDPVADKLMVATALILLIQQNPTVLFAIASAIIIGREITISALREWMAELGESGLVKVTVFGKVKTGFQMTAISFLLYEDDIWVFPILLLGQLLLYTAAALTLWSMYTYIKAAWPAMSSAGISDKDDSEF
jgi:CDP-diacylglycerol--glycerol-3-phosphate 3-phosphatidyltransferase